MLGRRGWFGDSHGHSLAAKGIYLKQKQVLVDPIYYARRKESELPFERIRGMVADGLTFEQMRVRLRGEDAEDIRKRGIIAVEVRNADNMLSALDKQGVDVTVEMARSSANYRRRVVGVLGDKQASSFLQPEKRDELRSRLGVSR